MFLLCCSQMLMEWGDLNLLQWEIKMCCLHNWNLNQREKSNVWSFLWHEYLRSRATRCLSLWSSSSSHLSVINIIEILLYYHVYRDSHFYILDPCIWEFLNFDLQIKYLFCKVMTNGLFFAILLQQFIMQIFFW